MAAWTMVKVKLNAQLEMKYKLIFFLMYSLYDFFDKCLKSSPVFLSSGAGVDEIYWKVLPTPGKGFSSNKAKNFCWEKKGRKMSTTFITKQ
jgi:hypothetical protein